MDFQFQIMKVGQHRVPTNVMGTDRETKQQIWIVVTRSKDGMLVAEAQKFGLKATGKDAQELFSAFEQAYEEKYKKPKPPEAKS